MRLKKYNEKRDFNITSEPKGELQHSTGKKFVVQFHQARKDHHDFRLEHRGVLVSWAVPKGLSYDKSDKRLAIRVEDHPIGYFDFEGIIPKGEYGAGKVEIFDQGYYKVAGSLSAGIKKGNFKIALFGKFLQGVWTFVHFRDDNWLIIFDGDIAENKTLKKNENGIKKLPFKKLSPQLALLSQKVPKGKQWIYEIKYDGYRIISFIEKGKVHLQTRNGLDYSSKFPTICQSLKTIAGENALVFDGEMVVFDEDGRSDFALLQENLKYKKGSFSYVIFDILAQNDRDLRMLTLGERKKILQKIAKFFPKNIILSEFVTKNGEECFNLAKKLGLEGIIAKNINSTYRGERNQDWQKIKCVFRQEFVIGGYTKSNKSDLFASILVGYYDNDKLIYVGNVGTGFSEKVKQDLFLKFNALKTEKNPFEVRDKFPKNAIYLNPKLVAEIQFAQITASQLLRSASFIALRTDKNPKDVVMEWQNEG